jgi:predicted enzyme related to lactoylglutathione lyase
MALATFRDIVIDCADPAPLATFWSEVLGYPIVSQDEETACLDPGDRSFRIWIVKVPEPKTVKNRVHIDINLEPGNDLDQLTKLGATVLSPFGSIPDAPWAVLADPEGNEFCAFPPK